MFQPPHDDCVRPALGEQGALRQRGEDGRIPGHKRPHFLHDKHHARITVRVRADCGKITQHGIKQLRRRFRHFQQGEYLLGRRCKVRAIGKGQVFAVGYMGEEMIEHLGKMVFVMLWQAFPLLAGKVAVFLDQIPDTLLSLVPVEINGIISVRA